jgi:cytochrome oxidase assembly protein ShyY1
LNELQQVKLRGRFVEGKVAFIGPRPPPQELPQSLASSASNSGVLIIRPLEREGSNGQVLILEGWSPHDKLGEIYTANHNISLSKNEVKELSGVIRRGEKINSYMSPSSSSSSSQSTRTVDPSNDSISEAARFTFLDVKGIARALGLRNSENNGQNSINSKDAAVIIELFRDDDILLNNSSNKKKNLNETIKHPTPLTFPVPRTLSSLRDGVHVPPSTHLIYAGTWFTLSLCGVALTAARFRGGRRSFRRT